MPRSRVLSLSTLFTPKSSSHSDSPQSATPSETTERKHEVDSLNTHANVAQLDELIKDSPSPTQQQHNRHRSESRVSIRPQSMVQTHSPVMMDNTGDILPELQPIFSFLNSHSNKLYQEGYFLKLHDLDTRGRPSADRTWTECFAQLTGTVLSLWDAAALDAAGEEGEVVPSFINLSDASLKMIESLPMNGSAGGNLQNVLSISTAANNRYLLHFNSLNSLTQWTAGIRLAMHENATLQEAYTGSLIAGKGRLLNNIKSIMERSRFPTEDWARVRFGSGTPWRRCWCVITPPNEKDYQKAQKTLKKKNAYERKIEVPKGDIKFYDTRKVTKKTRPIATITDAFAAYAIYPQSKPLIDQSTLVKLEGLITIHTKPETTTEGFLFVMPEVHPAVTGFEMMLRWLFPVFDTFALYGRPFRLIADSLDQRGLMFAIPRDRRQGYLDILDVSGLIHTEGSQAWSERQWRTELKKLTSHRMNSGESTPLNGSSHHRKNGSRTSLPSMDRRSLDAPRPAVRFGEDQPASVPVTRRPSPVPPGESGGIGQPPRRSETTPVTFGNTGHAHKRSVSDAQGYKRYQADTPSRLSYEANNADGDYAPEPPAHGPGFGTQGYTQLARVNSEPESPEGESLEQLGIDPNTLPVTPVANPPAFLHNPNSRPANRPYQAPDLRRANSAMDAATLRQLADAQRREESPGDDADHRNHGSRQEVVIDANGRANMDADVYTRKGMVNHLKAEHRLPSIPASPQPVAAAFGSSGSSDRSELSPLVTHDEILVHPTSTSPVDIPAVSQPNLRPPISERHSSGSFQRVARKALPQNIQIPSPEAAAAAKTSPSTPSDVARFGEDGAIHPAMIERFLQASPPRTATMTSGSAASDSVDYASTINEPNSPKKSVEKPRTGRLKTVGDATYSEEIPVPSSSRFDTFRADKEAHQRGDLPSVDFGPTLVYKPNPRPATSDAITPDEIGSGVQEEVPRPSSRNDLAEAKRSSYFGGRTTPSPGRMTPTDGLAMGQDNRRSMVWQPAGAPSPGVKGSSQTLTADQWVQYRAALASQPSQAPRAPPHSPQASATNSPSRNASGGTPPISRNSSGDWTQNLSRTPPPLGGSRPNSRGAGNYLNQQHGPSNAAHSPRLSAREQMHVARATGSPLLEIERKERKNESRPFSPGLVGALEARQKEKEAIRSGVRNTVVQQAIVARQQQQHQADMEAQMQAQMQMQQAAQQQAQQQAYFQQQAFAHAANVRQQQPMHPQWNHPSVQAAQQQLYQQQRNSQTPGAQSRQGSWYGGNYQPH